MDGRMDTTCFAKVTPLIVNFDGLLTNNYMTLYDPFHVHECKKMTIVNDMVIEGNLDRIWWLVQHEITQECYWKLQH